MDLLGLTISNYTPNMMKSMKHKCKYFLCNQPLLGSPLKKDNMAVVASLKTSTGFLKGQSAQLDTRKMFNTIMKIENT